MKAQSRYFEQRLSESSSVISDRLGDHLSKNTRILEEKLHQQTQQNIQTIQDLTSKMTSQDETHKQILGFANQLNDFQSILKNPKQRGTIVGEYYLEAILQKVLPPGTFQTQYEFTNGTKVDAVIFVGKNIIPIDSKFSLENYNRIVEAAQQNQNADNFVKSFKEDIKKRIDETSKYVQPNENTLEFAFMFIPHESIYYDLLVAEVGTIKINTQDLIQYAFEKKVIIVSPTSLLAYLQTVLQGLRALKIEESAKEIRKNVEELARHINSYEDQHQKLGRNLATVVTAYTDSGKEFKKIDKDIFKITGSHVLENELPLIEKPQLE